MRNNFSSKKLLENNNHIKYFLAKSNDDEKYETIHNIKYLNYYNKTNRNSLLKNYNYDHNNLKNTYSPKPTLFEIKSGAKDRLNNNK